MRISTSFPLCYPHLMKLVQYLYSECNMENGEEEYEESRIEASFLLVKNGRKGIQRMELLGLDEISNVFNSTLSLQIVKVELSIPHIRDLSPLPSFYFHLSKRTGINGLGRHRCTFSSQCLCTKNVNLPNVKSDACIT